MGELENERRGGRKKGAMAAAISATPTLHSQSSFVGLQDNLEKTRTDDFSGRRMRKCYSDSRRPPQNHRRRPLHKQSLSRANRLHHLFSPKDINASILSSENAWLQCSIIIALLVFMSCVSVPHGMTKSNSVIASRLLYMIILTDVTIVVARLLILGKQHEDYPDTAAGGHNAMLEIGLVLYQTIRALFIHCSFYLVLVFCGLSLF